MRDVVTTRSRAGQYTSLTSGEGGAIHQRTIGQDHQDMPNNDVDEYATVRKRTLTTGRDRGGIFYSNTVLSSRQNQGLTSPYR